MRDESMNFETYRASPHVKNTNKTTPAMFKSLEQPSPSDTWLQSQHNKTVILITAGEKNPAILIAALEKNICIQKNKDQVIRQLQKYANGTLYQSF